MQGLSAGRDHYFPTLPGYHKWGQWGEFPPLECDMSILVETAPEAQRKGTEALVLVLRVEEEFTESSPPHLLCSHPELTGWGPYSTKCAGNSDIGEPGPPGRRRAAWRRRPAELRGHLQSCGGTLWVRPRGSEGLCRKACPHLPLGRGAVITGRQ